MRSLSRRKRLALALLTVFVASLLALAGAEVLLRAAGRRPWSPRATDRNEPPMHEPDPVLGWRAIPGSYVVPPYASGSPPIRITMLPDGTRTTGPSPPEPTKTIAFLGGSYTQGWAVSDHETFPWMIQEAFPQYRIRNHGLGGYGTYQSLLVLERLLTSQEPPDRVFYGFMWHHDVRNVADPDFLRLLNSYSRRNMVSIPYCSQGSRGDLVCHPPTPYRQLPFREYLALANSLEQLVLNLSARRRAAQADEVTDKLLVRMNELAARHATRFEVVLLDFPPEATTRQVAFFEDRKIAFLDCTATLSDDLRVPGEGHPNGKMHARWASCISSTIAKWSPAEG